MTANRKNLWWLLLLIAPALIIVLFIRLFGIPPGYDPEVSFAVEKSIRTTYGKFSPRLQSDRTDPGPTLYASPRRDASTDVTIYRVTKPNEMVKIEAAARLALHSVPGAKSVKIRFLEAEVWESTPGGERRGNETELKSIAISKNEPAR